MVDISFLLLTRIILGAGIANCLPDQPVHRVLEVDLLGARVSLSNDFESGFGDPWYDNSPYTVHWVVEDFGFPAENYPPPTPLNGTKYLRATRDAGLSAGLLILRTIMFTTLPGDEISFNFWIHSKYTGGNTLEVVLSVGGVETIFLVLSRYSSPDNVDWRKASSPIPVTEPTEATLVFYSFCGGDVEDGIAIDDIVVKSNGDSTPATATTPVTTPTPVRTTTPTKTTTSAATTTRATTTTPATSVTSIPTTIFTHPTAPCVGDSCPTGSVILSDMTGAQSNI